MLTCEVAWRCSKWGQIAATEVHREKHLCLGVGDRGSRLACLAEPGKLQAQH